MKRNSGVEGMMVFAANDEGFRKRKRINRACEGCKKRRKRCELVDGKIDGGCRACLKDRLRCSLAKPVDSTYIRSDFHEDSHQILATRTSSAPPIGKRFIGDLNPEVVFVPVAVTETSGAGHPEASSEEQPQRDNRDTGFWAPSLPLDSESTSATPRTNFTDVSSSYMRYLESIQAFSLPDRRTQDKLVELYIRDIQPLLPLLDVPIFLKEYKNNTVSIPLLQSVLLVAIKHPEAAGLVLKGCTIRTWAATTAEKVIALIQGGIEKDRLTLTRIHALLFLHSEGPSGNETASLHLSTALHHAYGLGLHLDRQNLENLQAEVKLWWSLWALDGFQAVLCGRPLGVRKEDVSVPLPIAGRCGREFLALLRISELLVEVIGIYRPGKRKEWDKPWPSFEDVVLKGAEQEESARDDVLHLLCDAVTILSQRPQRPSQIPSLPRKSSTSARRLRSARSIYDLCSSRTQSKRGFLPLPIVPYALSLALATFYADLPASETEFKDCCQILEKMSERWWVAGAMAKMGRKAVERLEIQQAVGTLRGMQDSHITQAGDTSDNAASLRAGDGESTLAFGSGGGTAQELWVDRDEWWLQLFPDLAMPTGIWDAGGG